MKLKLMGLVCCGVLAGGGASAFADGAPAAPKIDPRAMELVRQMEAAYAGLHTFSVTQDTHTNAPDDAPEHRVIAVAKPNRFAVRSIAGGETDIAVSDGNFLYSSSTQDKAHYQKAKIPLPVHGDKILRAYFDDGILTTLLTGGKFLAATDGSTPTTLAVGSSGTEPGIDIVQGTRTDDDFVLHIGKTDHLLREFDLHQHADDSHTVIKYSDPKIDPSLPDATFEFSPSPGAKPVGGDEGEADSHLKPGATPFAFQTHDIDGKALNLAQYRGKVVLLDFWATWCGPCMMELPNVQKLYSLYHAKGFEIVGISLDPSRSKLVEFLHQRAITWRQSCDYKSYEGAVPQLYAVKGIPFSLLIGRDGRILSRGATDMVLQDDMAKAMAR